MKTTKEQIMAEIQRLMLPIILQGKGVDYGPAEKPLTVKQIQDSEMIEIQDYRGYNIKIIVK